MAYMNEALALLRHDDPSQRVAGARFELVVRDAFRAHPGEYGKERFAEVWLWKDWPDRERLGYDRQDSGIDLVARQTELWGGGLCAIQCKYGDGSVSTDEINSFITASDTGDFAARLLVTSRSIAKKGWEKIQRVKPECKVLHTSDMDDWVDDWRPYFAWAAQMVTFPKDTPPDPDKDRQKPPVSPPPPFTGSARQLKVIEFPKHQPRPYQTDALKAIGKGFIDGSKGKLILPCGTGKSFVALRAAEQEAGVGGTVLYLVPSIALMGQTMQEWSRHRTLPLQYLGVCSDPTTGRKAGDDSATAGDLSELAMPVTTDASRLKEMLTRPVPDRTMRVVFSTYHSTPKIAEALESLPEFEFNLIICDEAHRTTGISDAQSKKADRGYQGVSPFLLVHHNEHLPTAKRLFMTATPRVFTDRLKKKLDMEGFDGDSFSMDEESKFGPEFFRMSFADALAGDFLSDYEVLVITASESAYLQTLADLNVKHEDSKVSLDTAVKLAGCWDALATPLSTSPDLSFGRTPGQIDIAHGGPPARSAIAFCNTVRASKQVAALWADVASSIASKHDRADKQFLAIEVNHIDGTTPANDRADLLHRLREHAATSTSAVCRVLTNAQVLNEGVDVPALDAVLFLESRKSPIDITQAVGRAMRTAEGKQRGYIVIPVVVPDFGEGDVDARAQHILANGDFSPVWEVAQALRSHDERIDYWCNNLNAAQENAPFRLRVMDGADEQSDPDLSRAVQQQLQLKLNEQFASMLVGKVGNKHMYPSWGQHAARICRTVRLRIDQLLLTSTTAATAFEKFLKGLRKTVDAQITENAAVEMVAQHVVTIPVFDVMFDKSGFAQRNPMSKSINRLLGVFERQGVSFQEDLYPLRRAYQTMANAFHGAVSGAEKLDILRDIYDGFFKVAMSDEVKSLGIAYTPVELVDFMLRSVNAVCLDQFGRGLTAPDVHILDPFTGTGTFINRVLTAKDANGDYLISDEDLERKYTEELHANEIVLLAYYIAALKIEEAMYERTLERDGIADSETAAYKPFKKILLTDTFLMTEQQAAGQLQIENSGLAENNERIIQQNQTRIQVIIGNPPWSAGQKSADDDNPNREYEALAESIAQTYGKHHRQITGRGLGKVAGNLYIKAFRWASDRINLPEGSTDAPAVIAYVSPNSLSDGTSIAGMRAALRNEFTDIYVVNLRGNAYKSGEEFKREGDKVFGAASRNGVQITVLVRNPAKTLREPAVLHYAEVPEYSDLEAKFLWLEAIGDTLNNQFVAVPVNKHHDWVNLTDDTYEQLLEVCNLDKSSEQVAFKEHAQGILGGSDLYTYSYSRDRLIHKIQSFIAEYQAALDMYEDEDCNQTTFEKLTKNDRKDVIKWTSTLKSSLKRKERIEYDESRIREVLYRPFTKLWLYEDYRILVGGKPVSAMFDIATYPDPPPEHFFSTKPSNSPSEYSSQTTSSISAPRGVRLEHVQEGNTNQYRQQYDFPSSSDEHSSGPSSGQGLSTDAGTTASEKLDPPPSNPHHLPIQQSSLRSTPNNNPSRRLRSRHTANMPTRTTTILITAPSHRTVFATLATLTLLDFHTLDPATRVCPKKTPTLR